LGGQMATEDGPFASDTVTNYYNNRQRIGLGLQQPTGAWTNGFYYDAAKRLTAVVSPAGEFDYTRGGSGNLPMRISLPNTSYITNAYDSVARLASTTLKNSSGTVLDANSYLSNPANQRTQQVFSAGSTVNYTYDPIGQLKFADSATASEDRGYSYDTAWNLSYRTNNAALETFTVDGKNELTNSTPGGGCTYDDNGNLVSMLGGATTFAYDDENQLSVMQSNHVATG
jgi:hypothetical protein